MLASNVSTNMVTTYAEDGAATEATAAEEPAATESAPAEETAPETQAVEETAPVAVEEAPVVTEEKSETTPEENQDETDTADENKVEGEDVETPLDPAAAETDVNKEETEEVPAEDTTDAEARELKITYQAAPSEGGTVAIGDAEASGSQDETIDLKADTITVKGATASNNDGYEFVNWTDKDGNEVSQDSTYVPAVSAESEAGEVTYTANFKATEVDPEEPAEPEAEKKELKLTYTAADGGSVSETEETIDLNAEDKTIKGSTATANEGYEFVNWTDADGEEVSTDAEFVPEVSADAESGSAAYTANFDKKTVSVTYAFDPENSGTVTGSKKVTIGDDVTFTVKPGIKYSIEKVTVNDNELTSNSDADDKNKSYTLEDVKEDTEVVITTSTEVEHPEFTYSETINGVTVSVHANKGVLPEGVSASIEEIEVSDATLSSADLTDAVAYDINLYDADGGKLDNSWSENGTVRVSFAGSRIREMSEDADTLSVLHVDNSGNVQETVATKDVSGSTTSAIGFDASHFSIYVVGTDEKPALATYNFYDKDGKTILSTQIVKDGETLYEPEVKSYEGYKFVGWYTEANGNGTGFTAFGKMSDVETKSINLYAIYTQVYYVFFMDGTGTDARVIATKEFSDGAVITTDGVNVPLESTKSVTGWYTDSDLASIVDEKTKIKGSNVTLYPRIETGNYLTYESNGGTYIKPAFVSAEGITVEPTNPSRLGYDFDGWFNSIDLNESSKFTFGNTLSESKILYAKWTPASTTYKLVVWLEAANSTSDNPSYDYVTTLVKNGTTEETIALPTASELKGNNEIKFSIDKDEIMDDLDGKSEKNVTISGDGTAIANVYLDRKEYSIKFYSTNEVLANGQTSTIEKDYLLLDTLTITANFGADITKQWESMTTNVTNTYGTRVWVANPLNPGTTENPVVSPLSTMTKDMDLYYVINGSGLHHLELYVENLDNTSEIHKIDQTTKNKIVEEGIAYMYSDNYSVDAFKIVETFVFRGTGVHATISNYENALEGFTWVGADLATHEGYFGTASGAYTARHYYSRNSYTITYNNGDDVTTSDPIKYEASISDKGEAPDSAPEGTPTGSTFAGWYTSPTFAEETKYDFKGKTMPAKNLVLYAKWSLPSYTVIYKSDMNGTKDLKTDTVAYNNKVNKDDAPAVTIPEKYNWIGWATKDDTGYTLYNFDTKVESDVTLYPYYISSESCSLTYDLNGGTGTLPADSTKYAKGSYAKVASASGITAPAGKVFLGWKIDGEKTDTTIYYPGDKILMAGDITLAAQWGDQPSGTTLTYYANNGTDKTKEVSLGNNAEEQVKTIADCSFSAPDGMTFIGWVDGAGKTYSAGAKVRVDINEPNSNMLTACWAKLTAAGGEWTYDGNAHAVVASVEGATGYTIQYSVDGGSTWNSEKVPSVTNVSEGTVSVKVKATKTGYADLSAEVTLKITPATIKIVTPSASKTYDNSALTAAGTISGFVGNETATFTTTGSQTAIGSSSNNYSLVWDGTAVQSNYTVETSIGILTVTETGGGNDGGNNDNDGGDTTTSVTNSTAPVSNSTVPTVEPVSVSEATPPAAPSTVPTNGRAAATGDDSNMNAYGGIATASMIGLLAWVIVFMKRKKKEEA